MDYREIFETGVFNCELDNICRIALLGPHPVLRVKNDYIFLSAAIMTGLTLFVVHTDKIDDVKMKHTAYYHLEENRVSFTSGDLVVDNYSGVNLGYAPSSAKVGEIYLIKEKGLLNESERYLLEMGEINEYQDLESAILECSLSRYVCILHTKTGKIVFNYRTNNIAGEDNTMKFIREPAFFALDSESELFDRKDNWCFYNPKKMEIITTPDRRQEKISGDPIAIVHLEASSFDVLDS